MSHPTAMPVRYSLLLLAALLFASCSDENVPISTVKDILPASPAVAPYGPVPTPQQFEWQEGEMYMFVHFGINTFTDNDWGDGTDAPELFYPTHFDAGQWVSVAKAAGFKGLIFTAKHHDGFALWPTAFSDYSVANSTWKNGSGDVVGEVAEACRRGGLKFGIYLSPWDRHESSYGGSAYDDFYVNQLRELLTNYGPVFEVWLDGEHGSGADPNYNILRYHSTIRNLQPNALISSYGPDIRWVGEETGRAPETMWSPYSDTQWYPAECDVSIRPSWFWHESEDSRVKTSEELLDMYFKCVGRNSVLLLNVPPNRAGLFPDADVQVLKAFRKRLDNIFAVNLAKQGTATAGNVRSSATGWSARRAIDGLPATFWTTDDSATSSWLEISFSQPVQFNTIDMREAIKYGQRVESYRVEALVGSSWSVIARGTTIGYRKLERVNTVVASKVRFVIESSKANPVINEFSLYADPERI